MTDAEPMLVLGVDGGNTKTIAIVATGDGTVVGAGRAGCADIYNAESEAAALAAICAAVDDALTCANAAPTDLAVGAFSLAGADWPEDIELLEHGVRDCGFGEKIQVVNDAIGALRAGTPDGVGVGVALGTGIAIGARNGEGKVWYSGHWAVASGGCELGGQALQAVYEAHLGLAPETSLTRVILEAFGVATVDEVLHRTTARGTTWSARDQARLAPLLLDQAAAGDEIACAIVSQAASRHADAALAGAEAVGLRHFPFRLVLNGGVMRHPSGLLETAIRSRIEKLAPGVDTVHDPPEPVVGAVLMAIDLARSDGDPAVKERLVATLPGEEFFATS
jgi:N-acetylglucosamine kinase-like BadF-type ATPase